MQLSLHEITKPITISISCIVTVVGLKRVIAMHLNTFSKEQLKKILNQWENLQIVMYQELDLNAAILSM